MATATELISSRTGLEFWMERVIEECGRVSQHLAPDPVHDLRVALRRCRSMADGLMRLDSYPAWTQMKQAGKPLFRRLGDLRDSQVMAEWIHKLDMRKNSAGDKLLKFAEDQERQQKEEALAALKDFDRKQWQGWIGPLAGRARAVPLDSDVFRHLALERWQEARELHRRALRNRTKAAYHQLRIGIKRFRYTVENFLPTLHHRWEKDLKQMQDVLGEIHDLDVLWATALRIKAFADDESRVSWGAKIESERRRRLELYRKKMIGEHSLWREWRRALPQGAQVELLALQRLETWAALSDPDFGHTKDSAGLALQMYDGLMSNGLCAPDPDASSRRTLQIAALLRNVGRTKRADQSQKNSYRLMRRLQAPVGLPAETLEMAALVVRYHRGTLPKPGNKRLAKLSKSRKRSFTLLAGILRLADALDRLSGGKIRNLKVAGTDEFITVRAQGTPQDARAWEKIAAARYLLETACDRPVLVQAADRFTVYRGR